MITKEELLVALEDSSRNLYKSNEVFELALKGLESESTTKRLIQARDDWKKKHDDLVCEHRIAVGILNDTVGGLRRNRNFWKKKHDDLADELDDKIIALKDELKAKDDDWSLSVSYYMDLAAVWEKQAKALKAKLKKCEAVLAGKD